MRFVWVALGAFFVFGAVTSVMESYRAEHSSYNGPALVTPEPSTSTHAPKKPKPTASSSSKPTHISVPHVHHDDDHHHHLHIKHCVGGHFVHVCA